MVAQSYVPALVPRVGEIISIMLQISTFGVLAVCISESMSCENCLKGSKR
jgi:hypothetical protein